MNDQRLVFHLDMDAFYAAIEQRDNPSLRGRPVIVGSPPGQRGVVCAASYEARAFGVRSAMPSATAGRLCPKGVFITPRMAHYREESRQIMAIVRESGALIEQTSIDEAYLEWPAGLAADRVANLPSSLEYGSALAEANRLKERIYSQRRLTATIGIASNKLLAKLASDFRKPDGLTLIPERDKTLFLQSLPVRALHGVGKVTEKTLQQAGIETIADLQGYQGDLRKLVGSFAFTLRKFAVGEDNRPLETESEPKSIGSEETFGRDTEDRRILRAALRGQAEGIARELTDNGVGAHTVQVKIRYGDFTTLTRQITMEEPVTDAAEIYRLGCFLLARDRLVHRPLRLLGLSVSGFGEAAGRQLWLFDAGKAR